MQTTRGHTVETMVMQHLPLVKRIAYHLIKQLPPGLSLDDLTQAGLIGLLHANRHYDPSRGASFNTYASIRIRGSMLDEVRKHNWLPRSVHRNARELARAQNRAAHQKGRDVSQQEIAKELGVSMQDYQRLHRSTAVNTVHYLEDIGMIDDLLETSLFTEPNEPFLQMQQEDVCRLLTRALNRLPPRQQQVLHLYYEQDYNLKEIGAELGISESRVCQLHGQAMSRIQASLVEST